VVIAGLENQNQFENQKGLEKQQLTCKRKEAYNPAITSHYCNMNGTLVAHNYNIALECMNLPMTFQRRAFLISFQSELLRPDNSSCL